MKRHCHTSPDPLESVLTTFCNDLREQDDVLTAFWSPMLGDSHELYYSVFIDFKVKSALAQTTLSVHPDLIKDCSIPLDSVYSVLANRYRNEYHSAYIKEALRNATKKKEEG